ncbi:MAG: SusD/RagB family nutrient-binding outer membrane lipoprotein, partial [Bacteroides sp.]
QWDTTASKELLLEKIITQKWLACWPESYEAWTEQRRTGYPKLFKVQVNASNGAIDTDIMIRRLPFSTDAAGND